MMLSGDKTFIGFDSHCHLHFSHFEKDLDAVIDRSRSAGITSICIPGINVETSRIAADIAEKYNLYSAAALHPEHLPAENEDNDENWLGIKRILLRPNTIAVGETGLDLFHKTFSLEFQKKWFIKHIQLAEALGYSLIVHSRNAEREVLETLPPSLSVPVILHCWAGNQELTDIAVERGFYIGIGGPLTYKKNSSLRQIIKSIPHSKLLVETDAPFLPPEPFRGKRNEPAYSIKVIEKIRELWSNNMSIEGVSFSLWENAMKAFRLYPNFRRADIVYQYGTALYVNVTSKCNNNCNFCIRNTADGLGGYFLRHATDPTEKQVLSTIREYPIEDYEEIVFCGFGEPTLRHKLIMACAKAAKQRGVRTRLNTNGLCTAFLEETEVIVLLNCFDSVSISLNASGEKEYSRICQPSIDNGWKNLLKFINFAKKSAVATQLSVVEDSRADISRVKALAGRLELPLRIR